MAFRPQKPLWPFVLNQDCDLANGLIVYLPLGMKGTPNLYDLSQPGKRLNQKFALAGSPTWGMALDGGNALNVVAGSSQSASYGTPVVTATPLTMCAWFCPLTALVTGGIF